MTTEHQAVAGVTPDAIMQLGMGFMASKHLFVANEIGLFEQLAGGPATLDDLAQRTGVPRRTVRILADSMTALGLVERSGDRYQNGPVAAAFLSGHGPADLRPGLRFWNRISYPTWMGLEQAIRSGAATNRQGGAFSDEDQRIFSEGVEALGSPMAQALASVYDFGLHRRLLDLGGGTGSFLIPALRRHPSLRGTLFELPGAADVARRHLGGVPEGERVDVVAGNFLTDPIPPDHDAILVANVVHLFSPERNRELLLRARHAAEPGTRLLIGD